MSDTLTCPLCQQDGFKNLVGHIRGHALSIPEFRERTGYDGPLVARGHARLMAARSNALWADEGTRDKRTQGIRNSYTDELRAQRSADALEQWSDPAAREAQSVGLQAHFAKLSDEERVALVESNRAAHPPTSPFTQLRQALYARAEAKCERCGIPETEHYEQTGRRLHLHHRNYDRLVPVLEDVELLCAKCHHRHHDEQTRTRFTKVAKAVSELLKALGVSLTNENFTETPRRLATYLLDHFADGDEFEAALESCQAAVFPSEYTGMVVQQISCTGMCPHHLLPVLYRGVIGYIPENSAIGLSKIGRIAEHCLKFPLLQEEATVLLAQALAETVNTPHVAVVLEGRHMCMAIRGIRDPDVTTVTSHLAGAFFDTPSARQEFMVFARHLGAANG